MRAPAAAALAALLLAGCPLPQSLPDVPAGTITPPRILMDQITAADQRILFVPAGCPDPQHPTFPLSAKVVDVNTLELVRARWFVNYDANVQARRTPTNESDIAGSPDTAATERTVPTWVFDAYGGHGTATNPANGDATVEGALQIVELVVSNSFDDGATALPNRTATPGFETQVYRWVFVTKSGLPCPAPTP